MPIDPDTKDYIDTQFASVIRSLTSLEVRFDNMFMKFNDWRTLAESRTNTYVTRKEALAGGIAAVSLILAIVSYWVNA